MSKTLEVSAALGTDFPVVVRVSVPCLSTLTQTPMVDRTPFWALRARRASDLDTRFSG